MVNTTGRIQWKGTDVCMDVTCTICDATFHVDGEFAYNVQCPECETIYECVPRIELLRIGDGKTPDGPVIRGE